MKPINSLITKEQLEHLLNGGEMIYFVVDIDIEQMEIECDNCGGINESSESYCEHCNSEIFIDYIDLLSPIQPDTKYYLQKEFQTAKNLREVQCQPLIEDVKPILYKQYQMTSNKYNREWAEFTIWESASSMTEEEARHFFEFDVEIKRIKDVHTAREMENILGTRYITKSGDICIEDFDKLIDKFNSQHNNLHPNQPYESNPYIIIVKVKR